VEPVHIPVMREEVLKYLNPSKRGIYLDCTLGGGGHSQAILDQCPDCKVIGIEQDWEAINTAQDKFKNYKGRVTLVFDNFANLKDILYRFRVSKAQGALFDLGISSDQLDNPARGFSFLQEGPLDMRMNQRINKTAAEVVNLSSQDKLEKIFREYGEERFAAQIARAVVQERQDGPIQYTGEFVGIVKKALPPDYRYGQNHHFATQVFQALRIEVNNELENFQKALNEVINYLDSGARIVVISFHSLEDRITKDCFKTWQKGCTCPPELPLCRCGKEPLLKILTPKPLLPSAEEIKNNPRAHSAKMRVGERI